MSVCLTQEQADNAYKQADKNSNPIIVSLSDITELLAKNADARIDAGLIAPGSARLTQPSQTTVNDNSEGPENDVHKNANIHRHTKFLNRRTCGNCTKCNVQKSYPCPLLKPAKLKVVPPAPIKDQTAANIVNTSNEPSENNTPLARPGSAQDEIINISSSSEEDTTSNNMQHEEPPTPMIIVENNKSNPGEAPPTREKLPTNFSYSTNSQPVNRNYVSRAFPTNKYLQDKIKGSISRKSTEKSTKSNSIMASTDSNKPDDSSKNPVTTKNTNNTTPSASAAGPSKPPIITVHVFENDLEADSQPPKDTTCNNAKKKKTRAFVRESPC